MSIQIVDCLMMPVDHCDKDASFDFPYNVDANKNGSMKYIHSEYAVNVLNACWGIKLYDVLCVNVFYALAR